MKHKHSSIFLVNRYWIHTDELNAIWPDNSTKQTYLTGALMRCRTRTNFWDSSAFTSTKYTQLRDEYPIYLKQPNSFDAWTAIKRDSSAPLGTKSNQLRHYPGCTKKQMEKLLANESFGSRLPVEVWHPSWLLAS